MKLLPVLVLAAVFLMAVFSLSGCAAAPDYLTAAYVHQSVPFKGPGPAPIGDDEKSIESNMDGVELGAEWTGRRMFLDLGAIYALEETNMEGGPWHFTARVGWRVAL